MINKNNVIKEIQENVANIRNICIIAHVDHGKTSLTDSLLSSNNIISKKMAGKLRYLDDTKDEQEREITMKSSSCLLLSKDLKNIINIIDTPGHIDFSYEVDSALNISDGAILLVDALEGVLTQTYNVLKKAIDHNIKIILVINKIDKYFTTIKQKNDKIETILIQIIDSVNSIMNVLLREKITEILKLKGYKEDSTEIKIEEEKLHKKYCVDNYFCPTKDNVIFASSIHNWGFSINIFSELFSKSKLNLTKNFLQENLWGYKYLLKGNKISNEQPNYNSLTMFNTLILTNISNIYNCANNEEYDKLEKIVKLFQIDVKFSELKKDKKNIIQNIMNKWLPLDKIILESVVKHIKNPRNTFLEKYNIYFDNNLIDVIFDNSNINGIISKIIRINKSLIYNDTTTKNKTGFETVAVARLISGTLFPNTKINIKYNDNEGKKVYYELEVNDLYYFIGNSINKIDVIKEGMIFGFIISNTGFKKGTFSSNTKFKNLILKNNEKNNLKVNIYPENIEDYDQLLEGLRILNQIDPVCNIHTDDKGDFIIECKGEIHLEKCIKDLTEEYTNNLKIKISKPIITFMETTSISALTLKKRNIIPFNKLYQDEIDKLKVEEHIESDKSEIEEINKSLESKKSEHIEEIIVEDKPKNKFYSESSFYSDSEKEMEAKRRKEELLNKNISSSESLISYDEDCRFKFKAPETIYNDQKENKKEVNKKYKQMKVKKYDLEKITEKKNFWEEPTKDNKYAIGVQIISLNKEVSDFLIKNKDIMNSIFIKNTKNEHIISTFFNSFIELLKKVYNNENNNKLFQLILRYLVCFGPNKIGNNLLLNTLIKNNDCLFSKYKINHNNDLTKIEKLIKSLRNHYNPIKEKLDSLDYEQVITTITDSFNYFTTSGPICNEELFGNIIIIEYIRPLDLNFYNKINDNIFNNNLSIQEQLKVCLKKCFYNSFLGAQPRLAEPVFRVTAFADESTKNIFINIIKKRKGYFDEEIINDDYDHFERVGFFEKVPTMILPINKSFGFYQEVMKYTSGKVVPILEVYKYEIIKEDPFFQPSTKEEIEEHGEKGNIHNYAKIIVDSIRERKGILIDKIIVDANKQSTLKK